MPQTLSGDRKLPHSPKAQDAPWDGRQAVDGSPIGKAAVCTRKGQHTAASSSEKFRAASRLFCLSRKGGGDHGGKQDPKGKHHALIRQAGIRPVSQICCSAEKRAARHDQDIHRSAQFLFAVFLLSLSRQGVTAGDQLFPFPQEEKDAHDKKQRRSSENYFFMSHSERLLPRFIREGLRFLPECIIGLLLPAPDKGLVKSLGILPGQLGLTCL